MVKDVHFRPSQVVAFAAERGTECPGVEVVGLLLFSTLISLWGLAGGPWLSDHESIVAQGARQMLGSEEWLIPHVGDTPFVRKPPLAFWLAAATATAIDPASQKLPVSPLTARLPSGCAAILTTLLIYFLGRNMYGHSIGLICALITATAAGTLFFSHNAQVEMVLTFLCTGCFAFFWFATESGRHRKFFIAFFYVSFSLAMLAKAPLPLAVVGFPLAVWCLISIPLLEAKSDDAHSRFRTFLRAFKNQVTRVREFHPIAGVLIFMAIVLPWPLYVYMHVPNVFELWNLEFAARYTGELYGTNNPFWYYIPISAGFMVPYSLSLPYAMVSPFRSVHLHQQKPLLFALTWIVVTTVFLSTSAFKVPRYWIVCVPGAAILLGPTIHRMFVAEREISATTLRFAKWALLTGLCLGTVIALVWAFRDQNRAMMSVICLVAILALFGASAATLSFQPGRRLLSLFILQATVAITFALGWDVLGLSNAPHRKFEDLVTQLNALGVRQEDRITWVKGRPDARVIFYSGRRIGPLFNDSEIGEIRKGRQEIADAMLTEGIDRIRQRVSGEAVEYFIIDSAWWDRLQDSYALEAREVFRVYGSKGSRRDGLVVFTNLSNRDHSGDLADRLPTRLGKVDSKRSID